MDVDNSINDKGKLIASQLAVATEFGVITGNEEHIRAILHQAMTKDIAYIQVIDRFGNLLAETRNNTPEIANSDLKLFTQDIYRLDLTVDEPLFQRAEQKQDEKHHLGTLVVAITEYYSLQNQLHILVISLALGLVMLALSSLLAFTVGRKILTPLLTLTAAVRQISQGQLNTRVTADQEFELGALQVGFNSMAEKLEANQINTRKNLSQLEKARRSAEKASAAKSEFLATMSHELRTPMNGALGTLDLLSSTRLDTEQKNYVDIAIDSTNHLLTVVDDILDFSRIESGRMELESRFFNCYKMIENCYQSFLPIADKRGLALELEIDPVLRNLEINGDEARLRQIFINLVSNALKFTEDGGVFITVNCSGPSSGKLPITIAVKDTGIGIEASQQQGIFNSFQQEDGSTVRRFGGSGLGLAIVKQLCELMGAEIS